MDKSELKELLNRYKNGECSAAERMQVERWYQEWEPARFDLSEKELQSDLDLIKSSLPAAPRKTKVYYQMAAVVALVIAGISFYFTSGRLVSRPDPQITTITTPKGTQYKILLPDGSKVWLNAASSLKFKPFLKGKERMVELDGEGYFEVAKQHGIPFKVKSDRQEVEVLGTHFNIMDYKEDDRAKTTLLEGAVRVKSGNAEFLLHPGEQADLNKVRAAFNVTKIAAEESVAWKNGVFVFNHENIHSIMKKVGRWYDMEIVYLGKQTDNAYSGTVSRFENVDDVLKMLEITGTIHFKVRGRKIIVMD